MRNILVVEDSPMVLKILEQMFRQQADLQPLFCATLNEAQVLLEASAELFFAAIIDLNLPDAPNGEIVDLVLHYQLPCIVLTGSYDEQRREEMLLKGVVDYVLKESQYSYDYAFRLLHRLERNRSVKILVADDSNATRHFIRNVLRSHLYQIHEAADGEEALRILQEQPDFDLLITDHSMPGLSGFYEQGHNLLQAARRSQRPLSVAMLDLDLFKRINDDFGHASGDAALVGFARLLQEAFGQTLIGRLGGEEFALLSPQPAAQLASQLDQLRQRCAAVPYAKGAPPLSFSAGVYQSADEALETLLQQADLRLYQAKQQGRARTCIQLDGQPATQPVA